MIWNYYIQNDIAIRTISYIVIIIIYMYWVADAIAHKDKIGAIARIFTALLLITGVVYRLSNDYNMVLFFTTIL
jgi:hypothetical protein